MSTQTMTAWPILNFGAGAVVGIWPSTARWAEYTAPPRAGTMYCSQIVSTAVP